MIATTRQSIQVIADAPAPRELPPIAARRSTPTDRRLLLEALDAASLVLVDLVLWERDEPLAPEAFRAWAGVRGAILVERRLDTTEGPYGSVLELAPLPGARRAEGRGIQVFLLRRDGGS